MTLRHLSEDAYCRGRLVQTKYTYRKIIRQESTASAGCCPNGQGGRRARTRRSRLELKRRTCGVEGDVLVVGAGFVLFALQRGAVSRLMGPGRGSNRAALLPIKKPPLRRFVYWLRGQDLNLRPSGYEPDELPGCSTPRQRLKGSWLKSLFSRGLYLHLAGLAATYSPTS